MLEILPISRANLIAVRASGKLTAKYYEETLIPRVNELFAEYKRISMLLEFSDDFAGWADVAAGWDDAKLGLQHANDFEKLALVGAPHWVEWGLKLFCLFFRGEVKAFPAGSQSEAWQWIAD